MDKPFKLNYNNDKVFFGTCYAQEHFSVMYVPIEKNVTKVIRSMLATKEFKEYNFYELEKFTVPSVIILRDPIERWVTGLVEFLLIKSKSNLKHLEQRKITSLTIFKKIVFDVHTFPQTWFFRGLGPQCEFIWFDENHKPEFIETVSKKFNQHGIENTWNSVEYPYDAMSEQRYELIQFYKNVLKDDPNLLEKIKNFYAEDYKLINSVKFYT
jgi:hypothetical protein